MKNVVVFEQTYCLIIIFARQTSKNMKEKIKNILENALPLVDVESEHLYNELDSLGVTTILMELSQAFEIELDTVDATPKNLQSLDTLVKLVEKKLAEKQK